MKQWLCFFESHDFTSQSPRFSVIYIRFLLCLYLYLSGNLFVFVNVTPPQPKVATSSGDTPSYRFRSDVPAPPSNTALGGKASLLPKRTPVSDKEIEAILLGGCF
ncbi:unnamed protein product [Musa acuminata subsp. malaccensis]|uniref:(wild Malaysian banana) hypothetical protein n=1 Tax=Musa acuminata subsp. malaccensis TaxID=214687 RepID=A0A804J1L6_MUSAM|nr:unnamed protein product [Musa acuminata subsp. malaccensis]